MTIIVFCKDVRAAKPIEGNGCPPLSRIPPEAEGPSADAIVDNHQITELRLRRIGVSDKEVNRQV